MTHPTAADTQWIGWATYNAFLVTGNLTHVETILPKLAASYRDVYIPQYKAEAGGELCWKQSDGADAMEVGAHQHPQCTVHREESRGLPGR